MDLPPEGAQLGSCPNELGRTLSAESGGGSMTKLMAEAIAAYLESLEANGDPIPPSIREEIPRDMDTPQPPNLSRLYSIARRSL